MIIRSIFLKLFFGIALLGLAIWAMAFQTAVGAPPLTVSIDPTTKDLLIADNSGVNNDFTIKMVSNGSTIAISDAVHGFNIIGITGATGNGTNAVTIPVSQVSGSQIIFNAADGDDTLTVDIGNNQNPFTYQIIFNGEGETNGDALNLQGTATLNTATFGFINENDGTIDLEGNSQITYTGLEPVISTIDVVTVTLNYSTAAEIITVQEGPSDQTTVDSNVAGETVTFNNPTGLLRINPGDTGVNQINIETLAPVTPVIINYPASIEINGGNGGDFVNINGYVILDTNQSVDISARSIQFPNSFTSYMTVEGGGNITLIATETVGMTPLSRVSAIDTGDVTIEANTAGTSAGSSNGIEIDTGFATVEDGLLTMRGRGGKTVAGGTTSIGIFIQGSSTIGSVSTNGAVILEGYSNFAGTSATNGVDGTGILLTGNALVHANNGDITLRGFASGAGDPDGIHMVELSGDTPLIETTNGVISMTGRSNNQGEAVHIEDGLVHTAAPSPIQIEAENLSGNNGLQIDGTVGDASQTDEIVLTADDMTIQGAVEGNGSLHIQPLSNNTTIGLGGGSGTLNLIDAELANLSSSFTDITIGNAQAGDINLQTTTFSSPITLQTSGQIIDTDDSGIDMTSSQITLLGDLSPGASTVATFTVSGDLEFADNSALTADISGTIASETHDRVRVAGDITIGSNVALNLNTAGYISSTGTITIVKETGNFTGIFNSLPNGAQTNPGTFPTFQINYNSVFLTALPAASAAVQIGYPAEQITMFWGLSGENCSYDIYRSTTPYSGYTTIATGVTSSPHTDNTADPLTNYFYAIQSHGCDGGTAASNGVSAFRFELTPGE